MKTRSVFAAFGLAAAMLASSAANGAVILSEDFEGGIPGDWTTVDAEGNGVGWDTNTFWGEGNYTNGSGLAAMVCSDCFGTAEYDASLISSTFSLAGFSDAQLSYTVNYQNFAFLDFLDVDISLDGGASWLTLLSWNEDHGTFFDAPGEDVILDLDAFLGETSVNLRWRHYDPNTGDFDWYAQVDDILVEGTPDAVDVPAPAALGLFGLGMMGLIAGRRRKQSA